MSNKYDVWRFNLAFFTCLLRSLYFFANAIAYSMVGISHAAVNILCKQPLLSARNESSNIVFIQHKLSLSCSICDFIKHKCSFKAIIILALNSPLSSKWSTQKTSKGCQSAHTSQQPWVVPQSRWQPSERRSCRAVEHTRFPPRTALEVAPRFGRWHTCWSPAPGASGGSLSLSTKEPQE